MRLLAMLSFHLQPVAHPSPGKAGRRHANCHRCGTCHRSCCSHGRAQACLPFPADCLRNLSCRRAASAPPLRSLSKDHITVYYLFGTGPEGRLARLLSAISNLVVTMAFLTYFVEGTGKFLSIFLPFGPETCSLFMIVVAISYTALSGFFGVIYTDIIQECFIVIWIVVHQPLESDVLLVVINNRVLGFARQ